MCSDARMQRSPLALVTACLLGLAAGCGSAEPAAPTELPAPAETTAAPAAPAEAPPPAAEPATAESDAVARANGAATELGRTLRERLLAAMAEGGPARAAEVCSTEAQAITASIAERTGVRVGRGSLRMRGASPPPAWVGAWLTAQGERPAAGVEGFARVEEGHARVVRPIAVEAPCVTCHGETLAPEIAAILDARYPGDRARGYAVGDLRGALWAEADVR
jgi:hypothetical protein